MRYSRSLLLYQDEPAYGAFLKLIIIAVPVMLLAGSTYMWLEGDSSGALALLIEGFFIGVAFWVVFPRKYQVYEDQVRVVLGGPFSVKVPFDQVKAVEVTSRLAFTVNFVTRLTSRYVAIVRRRGISIAITPKASDQFVEQANRALSDWARVRGNTA